MTPSRRLAAWIDAHNPYRDHITHLKLQKLMFYCAGVALAFDLDGVVGEIPFEPWEHGPVNREVWRCLRHHKSKPLPSGQELVSELGMRAMRLTYGSNADAKLMCALKIYGSLDAWSLRCQTHREAPWKEAFDNKAHHIDTDFVRNYFKQKYRSGPVSCPAWVLDPGSFTVDGIPVHRYRDIEDLAESVNRSLS